jgi:hypothetical protein
MDIEQLRTLKAKGEIEMKRLIEVANKLHRFEVGDKHEGRLEQSLRWTGKSHLKDKTLISHSLHRRHSKRLAEQLIKRWKKVQRDFTRRMSKRIQINEQLKTELKIRSETKKIIISEHEIANKHIRFLTLIDSVCVVDAYEALILAVGMRNELIEVITATNGISCLGVIEASIVAIKKMNEEATVFSDKEFYKLDGINILAKRENLTEYCSNQDAALFLIHFHGVIFAKKEEQFEIFESNLKQNIRWNVALRQFELKKLSKSYDGKTKTIEQNLKHIASYMTKGANALKDGYFYNFKYKIGPSSEEDWIAHHYSSNKSSKEFKASLKEQHYAEDDLIEVVGVEDTLSLSAYEIGEQVQLVDYLMSLDDTRTGYLINIE